MNWIEITHFFTERLFNGTVCMKAYEQFYNVLFFNTEN